MSGALSNLSSGESAGLRRGFAAAILGGVILIAYANSFPNGFYLDDTYGLLRNEWIRDLRNIPRFFSDPYTLTSYRPNADYRPLLQASYALNYAVSGYAPWSWHLLNILLHWIVATHLFLLGRILFGRERLHPCAWLSPREGDVTALAGAVIFAIHPLGTGCLNYFWARSSLLVAALVLPATVLYLGALGHRERPGRIVAALALYVLALFTKAEAISLFGVLLAAEILWTVNRREPQALRRAVYRLLPFAAATLAYLYLRHRLIPQELVDARHAADVTGYDYFLTQLRAWWHYIGIFFVPVGLIADNLSFPVSRSLTETRVLLAGVAWLGVAAVVAIGVRRVPALAFLALAFFIHLAPHSSFLPLAEMVNEHRPYLPCAGLFLLEALAIAFVAHIVGERYDCNRGAQWSRRILIAGTLVLAIPYTALTIARNTVWRNDYCLWFDTVSKIPSSSRAQMNFGLALMARGRLEEAERHIRKTIRLAPYYHFARTNLAIVLAARGDPVAARAEHDHAVRLAPNEPSPYEWRGRFLMSQNDWAGAIADFRRAAARSLQPGEIQKLLDQCIKQLNETTSRPQPEAGRK